MTMLGNIPVGYTIVKLEIPVPQSQTVSDHSGDGYRNASASYALAGIIHRLSRPAADLVSFVARAPTSHGSIPPRCDRRNAQMCMWRQYDRQPPRNRPACEQLRAASAYGIGGYW